ncbi:MAG: patatin-like phospholipase family protein [Firmicutes bacterium]|nr:patatin-like phospholipase family protein [Bacillota bacterium]
MAKNKKTALVLGGGGSRGAYEIGVWQALRELGIKLDIVCGTSVGSINGAVILQDEFDLAVKLWQELNTEMIFNVDIQKPAAKKNSSVSFDIAGIPLEEAKAYAKEIIKSGGAAPDGLAAILEKYIDEDAIRRSPIEYGLTAVELPMLTLRYLYKEEIPQGKLIDYIIASSAIAPAVQPHKIDETEYIDGGFADVVPIELALKKGASNIIAVNLNAAGVLRRDKLKQAKIVADKVTMISCPWDMGSVLVFNKDNAKRLIRLGYLDTMKTFDIFSGNFYAFPHRIFDQKTLRAADTAAKIFELDPTLIYTRESLNSALSEKIKEQKSIMKRELLKQDNKTLRESRPFKLFAAETFELLSKKLSRKTIVIMIADELKKDDFNQVLASRAVHKFLAEELASARYITANDLI